MTKLLAIALLGIAMNTSVFAQSGSDANAKDTVAAGEKFYRLDFSARELEGERIVNAREYSLILSNTSESSSMRAGANVPVGPQLVHVGVYIDCKRARDVGNKIRLSIRAEINTMVENGEKSTQTPITRNTSWQSEVVLPFRKPTLLFSSDDLATKRKMQLVLTVTPVD